MCVEGMTRSSPWVLTGAVPHIHYIVIPSTCQEAAIVGPLESTHIQSVSSECVKVRLSQAWVMMLHLPILTPTTQHTRLGTPGEAAHSRFMTTNLTYTLADICIPNLCRIVPVKTPKYGLTPPSPPVQDYVAPGAGLCM